MTHPGDPGYASAARATATGAAASGAPRRAAAPAVDPRAPPARGAGRPRGRRDPRRRHRERHGVPHVIGRVGRQPNCGRPLTRAELNIRGPIPLPGGAAGPNVLLDVAGQPPAPSRRSCPTKARRVRAYISEDAEGIVDLGPLPTRRARRGARRWRGAHDRRRRRVRRLPGRSPSARSSRLTRCRARPAARRGRNARPPNWPLDDRPRRPRAGSSLAIGSARSSCAGAAPLARVAATAPEVSELPLDRGEVALTERVPDDDADPRTEVGRVGAALNRMLEHVASALSLARRRASKVRTLRRRRQPRTAHAARLDPRLLRAHAHAAATSCPTTSMHAIGRIEAESVRMTALVEDLLLLARLDEGRELVARARRPGRALVVDAVERRAARPGPDHDWALDLPDEPRRRSPATRRGLHQVVANLLANARMHTPAGTTVASPRSDGEPTTERRAHGARRRPRHRPASSCRRCSSGSRAATSRARGRPAAPGSGSRSSGRWSRRTTARSRSRASRARRSSPWNCRCRSRRSRASAVETAHRRDPLPRSSSERSERIVSRPTTAGRVASAASVSRPPA